MEVGKRKIKDYINFSNLLVLYEIILFSSILTFFILLFETHPPGMTCDIVLTKTWVLVFAITFSILRLFPLLIYSLINRKSIQIRKLNSFIRLGTISLFCVSALIYSIQSQCRFYVHLGLYQLIIFISILLPLAFQTAIMTKTENQNT